MEKSDLRQILIDQQEIFNNKKEYIERELDLDYYLKGNEIVIISGIRRCGKSTLLKLLSEKFSKKAAYINFDDVKFVSFSLENFEDIEKNVLEIYGKNITYYLDEIQNIPYWEKWVNNLYSKNIKVFVTGSNSNLLSSEISTYLTGRNKVIRLNPFSFNEYLKLKKINFNLNKLSTDDKVILLKHFKEYFENGGFPLILKNNDLELSKQYFEDILNKDILSRYNIREQKELKDLILFLFSNVGSIYSYSTLKSISGIKSLSTIKNYISYFENVFLLYQINRFDYSIKKQKVSSSKIYVGDNSFLKTVAFNFSENKGNRLENLVFLNLKNKGKEIYYHLNKKECDFVIKEGLKITQVIQVSLSLSNPMTKKREIEGLIEAMNNYKLKEGLILTEDEESIELHQDKKIIIKPIWKWLLENENS